MEDDVDFEMLLGMGEHVALAVAQEVGSLRLYTPVVHPREFDVALAYLVRRLEEVASKQNFMSSLYDMDAKPEVFERERGRFVESWNLADEPARPTHRVARRPRSGEGRDAFSNTPDVDPAVTTNREWARDILTRAIESHAGMAVLEGARVDDAARLDHEIAAAHEGARTWQAMSPEERSNLLHAAGDALERAPCRTDRGHDLGGWQDPRPSRPGGVRGRSTSRTTTRTGRSICGRCPAQPPCPAASPWSRHRGTSRWLFLRVRPWRHLQQALRWC